MRVFGIDCGTEFTGYGVVEVDCEARMPRLVHLAAGTIRLNKKEKTPQRLAQVYAELTALMALHQPEVVAIEEVFFSANAKSALKLGQVRGVAMLAAATSVDFRWRSMRRCRSRVRLWAMVLAAKEQVQFMVTRLLESRMRPIRRCGRCVWRLPSVTSTRRRHCNCRALDDESLGGACPRAPCYRLFWGCVGSNGFTSTSPQADAA